MFVQILACKIVSVVDCRHEAKSKKSKSKSKRISFCETYVRPVDKCNGNSNSNCNSKCNFTVTGLPRSVDDCKGKCKHASFFSEASASMIDNLRSTFPL